MRTCCLLALSALVSCSQPAQQVEQPVSACSSQQFEEASFTVCRSPGPVEVRSGFRSFGQLQSKLGGRADQVAFAMNAGMFDEAGQPIGLMIEDGKEVHGINRRSGGGNFHLLPNGVFLVRRSGETEVVTTEAFQPNGDIMFASQSGPMLLINGRLHQKFDHDGTSRYVRNGVGIGPAGDALFVISEDLVSFGKFARFFRDRLKVRNALYFDGSVSSLWDPANGRMDSFTELGPIAVAFKSAASKPGREAPATP